MNIDLYIEFISFGGFIREGDSYYYLVIFKLEI